jgi:hypothetical protein
VRILLDDSKSKDGDTVSVTLNDSTTPLVGRANLNRDRRIPPPHFVLDIGHNHLKVRALNEGSSSPNTARVTVDPCRHGAPKSFDWSDTNMKTGDIRIITIVREPN